MQYSMLAGCSDGDRCVGMLLCPNQMSEGKGPGENIVASHSMLQVVVFGPRCSAAAYLWIAVSKWIPRAGEVAIRIGQAPHSST